MPLSSVDEIIKAKLRAISSKGNEGAEGATDIFLPDISCRQMCFYPKIATSLVFVLPCQIL